MSVNNSELIVNAVREGRLTIAEARALGVGLNTFEPAMNAAAVGGVNATIDAFQYNTIPTTSYQPQMGQRKY